MKMLKKKICTVILLACSMVGLFAEEIATTYQTNLMPKDMVEVFIEECNRDCYAYVCFDYEVFTDPEKQNYAWTVYVNTDGYDTYSDYRKVHIAERSVVLCTKNGKFSFRTFGGPTTIHNGLKSCIDGNTGDNFDAFIKDIKATKQKFFTESVKWLKRYGKEYSSSEKEALEMLKYFTLGINALFDSNSILDGGFGTNIDE